MSYSHLTRTSTAVRIAELLRERIGSGDIAPGERIVELELARELGVSRSPIREALLRLSDEGLVTLLPYRGAIAAPLRRDRLQELMEFRMALEHFALERLLDRATDETVRVLRAQVTATREAIAAGDLRRAVEEDLSMHRSLVAFAGNSLLERAYEGVLSQVRLYIHVTSSKYERAEDLADEHDALIDAIARGDGPLARQLLDAHIMHGFTEALGENAPESDKEGARN